MREILFKGKPVLDPAIWVEGSLLQSEIDVNQLAVKCEIHERFADSFSIAKHEVIPETVSEWLGLRDRNNKRIFENDIVKAPDGSLYRIWVENSVTLYGGINKEWDHYLFALNTELIEVVGNIFDNPELLK